MRLKLNLRLKGENNLLPFSYNYQLASVIYKLLKFGSPEFSKYLHDAGYKLNGKKYKLFTFSLRLDKFEPAFNFIKLTSPFANLIVSSPLVEDFIKTFVIGVFENQTITINHLDKPISFAIQNMELMPEPEFSDLASFISLSPLVFSTVKNINGKLNQYYLRPEDSEEINRVLLQNLQNKYEIINKQPMKNPFLNLKFDPRYSRQRNRITKKITVNINGINPIDVIGLLAPFTINANPELIKTGYDCGFGEKNSMGFGMTEII